jgi:hypothetical protein
MRKSLQLDDLPPEVFRLVADRLLLDEFDAGASDLTEFACLRLCSPKLRQLCDSSVHWLNLRSRNVPEVRQLLQHFDAAERVSLHPSCDFAGFNLKWLGHLGRLRDFQLPALTNVLSFEGLSRLTQITAFASEYTGNTQRDLMYEHLAVLTGLQSLDCPMVLQTEGIESLTALSRLTRLVLEGDGFGMAELAMKLPALARLDLRLTLVNDIPDPELAAMLGRLGGMGSLRSFALEAGPTQGMLRHLQLPRGLTATTFLQLKDASQTESGKDVAHLLAMLPALKTVGIGGRWAANPDAWAAIVPSLGHCEDLRFSGPLGDEAGAQIQPLASQLTSLSLEGALASSATVGAAKVVFGGLVQCRDVDLKGCNHLDGSVFGELAATAGCLLALNCEDVGRVDDGHLEALMALSRLTSLRLVRAKSGAASVNITNAGIRWLGKLPALRNLKFDLAIGRLLSDDSLRQLSALRLTSLSLPPLGEAAGAALDALAACRTTLRELSVRGIVQSEAFMPAAAGFARLTSLRLRVRAHLQIQHPGLFLTGAPRTVETRWQLRDLTPLPDTPAGPRCLRRLALAYTDLDDANLAAGLQRLDQLQELSLVSGWSLTGTFMASAPTSLMRLSLEYCQKFKAASLVQLRRLARLTELRVTSMPAACDAAAGVLAAVMPPHLAVLQLSLSLPWPHDMPAGAWVTDEGVAALAAPALGPCRLRHLDLSGQRGLQDGAAAVLAAGRFPALELLQLNGTLITDAALLELAPLAGSLEEVSILGNPYITQEGVDAAYAAFAARGGKPEIRFS